MNSFTGSPYEKMMKQKPRAWREESLPSKLPACKDCPYQKDGICIGVCYRELLKEKKEDQK